jgi:hypothetical protein
MTILIDCAPQLMALVPDRQHNLVEVPFVAPSWLTPAQLIGKLLAKPQCPLADRLVGHNDTPACHQLLDVAKAQRETEIEPYHMADDLPGVAEAAVELGTCHPSILSRRDRLRQIDSIRLHQSFRRAQQSIATGDTLPTRKNCKNYSAA